ncbi:hypothetical protein A6456_29680 [Paraburkholderia tropica]|nr:hypothetical protein A6456_29680 [Paraburkholderia tropica]
MLNDAAIVVSAIAVKTAMRSERIEPRAPRQVVRDTATMTDHAAPHSGCVQPRRRAPEMAYESLVI